MTMLVTFSAVLGTWLTTTPSPTAFCPRCLLLCISVTLVGVVGSCAQGAPSHIMTTHTTGVAYMDRRHLHWHTLSGITPLPETASFLSFTEITSCIPTLKTELHTVCSMVGQSCWSNYPDIEQHSPSCHCIPLAPLCWPAFQVNTAYMCSHWIQAYFSLAFPSPMLKMWLFIMKNDSCNWMLRCHCYIKTVKHVTVIWSLYYIARQLLTNSKPCHRRISSVWLSERALQ